MQRLSGFTNVTVNEWRQGFVLRRITGHDAIGGFPCSARNHWAACLLGHELNGKGGAKRLLFSMSDLSANIIAVAIGALTLWLLLKRLMPNTWLRFRLKTDREVHVVENAWEWENVYPTLVEKCTQIKAVGFDCEWVVRQTRRPVSLIQIATFDGFCILVRVHKMSASIPDSLRQFLAHRSILKVGVSAADDAKKLGSDYGLLVNGCVDLRHILGRVRGYKCPSKSLQGVAQGILGITMAKEPTIRCGNWEATVLSNEQVDYAAEDALVAIDIFMQLSAVKICRTSQITGYYGSHVNVDETEFGEIARSLCQGVVDIPFNTQNSSRPNLSAQQGSAADHSREKVKVTKAYMTRQTPLYYNCRLLAPDGALLTTCDLNKANWYLSKDLGVKVCDDPVTVRLNFEPTARPTSDQDYYLQEKENVCVVCGRTEDYIRKLIVPQEYRKYFPTILKDHASHDILLMCLSCHATSNASDAALRQSLAQECDAPLDSGKGWKTLQDQDLQKVVSAAKALLKSRKQIPAARLHELETLIRNFYGVTHLSEELLREAVKIDSRVHNSDFVPHGKRVVDYYRGQPGGLLEFEKKWRRHFVETMKPQYLPNMWSVDHVPERMVIYNGKLVPKVDIK